MLKRTASRDRQIYTFQRPYNMCITPYKQFDFSDDVKNYCFSNSIFTGQRIAKAIVLGDMGVGKTSLVRRFCHEIYDNNYKATIGVDFEVERFDVLNSPFNIQIWDTAGQERFKCIASSYYRSAHVIVVVFDLSRISSLQNCSQWLKDALKENLNTPSPHIFLIGNKLDCVSSASFEAIESFAATVSSDLNAEYWAVSSKTGENINELFFRIVCLAFDAMVMREKEEKNKNFSIGSISLGEAKKKKKACRNCNET